MDEAAITALVSAAIAEAARTQQSAMNSLQANLKRDVGHFKEMIEGLSKPAEPGPATPGKPEGVADPEVDLLKKEIATLKSINAESALERRNALIIAEFAGTQDARASALVFQGNYEITDKKGTLTARNKTTGLETTLDAAKTEFLESSTGKLFIAASDGGSSGLGGQNTTKPGQAPKKLSWDDY
jgi:hypothetical protein